MRLALFLAARLLRRRGSALLRTSAAAALAAVMLGTAALVVTLALMTGYSRALRSGILAAGGHIVALTPDGGVGRPPVEALASLPGVARVSDVTYLPGVLVAEGGGSEVVLVKAAAVLPRFAEVPAAVPGRPLPIAIGEGVARRLGARPGAGVSLQVATGSRGVATTAVAVHRTVHTGFSEIDDRWALAVLGDLSGRVGGVTAQGAEVWLADPERAAEMAGIVEEALEGKALVTTWQDANRNLFAALRWQKLSLGVVLSLVLGVGAFEVASALVVLVTEKRRALGVLLAIGGRPALLRGTLVLAGGTLGAAGVLSGVALGLGLSAALSALGVPTFPPEIAAIYGVDRIPLSVEPGDVLAVVGLGVAEVLLAALLPAHRAARREPVEILRWI